MRSKTPLKFAIACSALALVAGCSQKAPDEEAGAETVAVDAASSAGSAQEKAAAADTAVAPDPASAGAEDAPGLTTSAAAGVAFTYNYAFTLPAKAISGVQQQHAVACERLGPTRCKITGMTYEQPSKDAVSARLDLMLAPEYAQRFGADATAVVERADGTLETANVNGQNAGGAIEDSQRRSETLRAGLDRIEKRLAAKGLSDEERQSLAQRADELRGEIGQERQVRGEKEAALTLTPMSIAYGSEGLFAAKGNPFGSAAKASLGSMDAMLTTVLTLLGFALPWLLLGGVILLAMRFYRLKRQFAEIGQEAVTEPAAQ